MQRIRRAIAAALIALAPGVAKATVISRLELDHPAQGATPAATVYAQITAIYTKIGNAIDSRYFEITGLANAGTADLEHNFKAAFATLTFDVYSWNSGTGELTLLTAVTSPTRASIGISATPSFLTTKTRVTNSSGSSQDLVVIIHHNSTDLDELADVTITTPSNGQVLTYDTATTSWLNKPSSGGGGGAGGASWFSPSGTGAVQAEENGQLVYLYPDATDSDLTLWVGVPQNYVAGNQISLDLGSYSPSTSNGYVLKATSYLVRTGTDAVTSTTNSNISSATLSNGSPANKFRSSNLTLTSGSGQINSVAVSVGDQIRVVLTRDYANGSDTDTADVRFAPGATGMRTF